MRLIAASFWLTLFVIVPSLAQHQQVWIQTHEIPQFSIGDPRNHDTIFRSKMLSFPSVVSKVPYIKADMVDGAKGTHYAVWGNLLVWGVFSSSVWVSSDAGVTWKESLRSQFGDNAMTGWEFSEISYPEPNHIFIVSWGDPELPYSKILKTTDGGISWSEILIPRSRNTMAKGQISMSDSINGILYLDKYYITSDGWKTWSEVKGPKISSPEIFSPKPSVFFIRGYSSTAEGWIVSRSTDGGTTWSDPQKPITSNLNDRFDNIIFVDKEFGWATGMIYTGVLGQDWKPFIYKTEDGGITWFEPATSLEYALSSCNFFDRMNGIAVGGNGVVRTNDGGKTWVTENVPHGVDGKPINIAHFSATSPTSAVALSENVGIFTMLDKTTLAAPVITYPGRTLIDSKDTVTIIWTPIQGATSYQLQLSPRPWGSTYYYYDQSIILDESNITSNSRLVQIEYSEHNYNFRVRAMNQEDTSAWSVPCTVTPLANSTALTTSQFIFPKLDAKDVPTTIQLRWNAVPKATAYHLKVGTNWLNVPQSPVILDTFPIYDTTFLLTGLTPLTTYHCAVKALNDDGESYWSWVKMPHFFETAWQLSSVQSTSTKHSTVSIAPNPANEQITISASFLPTAVEVIDMTGQTVRNTDAISTPISRNSQLWNLTVPIHTLPSGVYMVRITSSDIAPVHQLLVIP